MKIGTGLLFEVKRESGSIYIWSGTKSVNFNGDVYFPLNTIVTVDKISNSEHKLLSIEFRGFSLGVLSLVGDWKRTPVEVWLGTVGKRGKLNETPTKFFRGFISNNPGEDGYFTCVTDVEDIL